MDEDCVNQDDERIIKTLLKNEPTFSEETINFYLSYTGCKVVERSCLRLISLALHKSIDHLIDRTLSIQTEEEVKEDKKEDTVKTEEKELKCEALTKALEETSKTYEGQDIRKIFNAFLE